MNSAPNILVIVGPTAVGKSEAALGLAQRIGGEIVSCDAMQVYRELPIASNQPSLSDLRAVAHHMVGCWPVTEHFDAYRYRTMTVSLIEDILNRGRVPIIAGGSGLYVSALLDGIFEGRGADPALRADLLQEALVHGADHMHDRLKTLDAQAAANIHPNNVKRVIRALEICLTHDQPASGVRARRSGLIDQYRVKMFGLTMPREIVYQRIHERTARMMEGGIVEEIAALKDTALSETARAVIGVEEMQGYLNGEFDLKRAAEMMNLRTRHLAKRQMTWFRKDQRVEWLEIHPEMIMEDVIDDMEKRSGF